MLRDRELAWVRERDELLSETRRLRSQLHGEVRALAQAAIVEARQDAAAVATATRADYTGRVFAGLDALEEEIPGGLKFQSPDSFTAVAVAFGIEVGDWIARKGGGNRESRRTTNASARVKLGHLAAIRAQGERAVPEAKAWLAHIDEGRPAWTPKWAPAADES